MDRVRTILGFQWRAYWRRFRGAGSLKAGNIGVLLPLGGLMLVRYLQQLPLVANQLAKGETARYQNLLLAVFLTWVFAIMAESKRSITSCGLLHLPLTNNELFLIRLGSVFCSPIIWIVAGGSLVLVYPVTAAVNPVAGVMALLLFLLLGLWTGLTMAHLLSSKLARRLFVAVVLLASVVGGLLWSSNRANLIAPVKELLPTSSTAAAAVSPTPYRSILWLLVITALVGWLAQLTFALTLQPKSDRRSQRFAFFGSTQFPGRFGGLLKKDLRYSSRLLDVYLALPIVIFFNLYLMSDPIPSAVVLAILIGFLFTPCVSLAFNCFGLESPLGLDRHTLFPLSGREKLLSKNLAFGTLMIVLFVMLLPLTFLKLGAWTSGLAFMELIVVGLAYAAYGNWLSVKQPFKIQFYRFASGGSPVDAVMGMIFGSLPAVVTVLLLYHEAAGAYWKMGVMTLIYLAIFWFSLSRSGALLERHREELRRSLS